MRERGILTFPSLTRRVTKQGQLLPAALAGQRQVVFAYKLVTDFTLRTAANENVTCHLSRNQLGLGK